MKKVSFYFCLLFFSLLFFRQINPAEAQDAQPGFSINPFYQSIDIQRDQQSVPFSVKLKNTTSVPAVFRVTILDFGTLDESGGVAFLGASDNLKYGLASWVKLPNDTLVLAPGEEQTVSGTIENRESLSPGGHYGAVFFKIEDNSGNMADGQKDAIAFNPSMASLLFVRKIGGEIYALNLDSFDFARNIFIQPDKLSLRFQNPGNVHIVPRGTAEVFDPLGRLIAKSIVNSDSGIILPETFRMFSAKFMSIAPAFIPGRYTMLINYRYDGKADFAPEHKSFFFIPPYFILAVLFLIGIVIFGRYYYSREKVK